MSRIGKNPIIIPEGVTVSIDESKIIVKGKLGELLRSFLRFHLNVEDGTVQL